MYNVNENFKKYIFLGEVPSCIPEKKELEQIWSKPGEPQIIILKNGDREWLACLLEDNVVGIRWIMKKIYDNEEKETLKKLMQKMPWKDFIFMAFCSDYEFIEINDVLDDKDYIIGWEIWPSQLQDIL